MLHITRQGYLTLGLVGGVRFLILWTETEHVGGATRVDGSNGGIYNEKTAGIIYNGKGSQVSLSSVYGKRYLATSDISQSRINTPFP